MADDAGGSLMQTGSAAPLQQTCAHSHLLCTSPHTAPLPKVWRRESALPALPRWQGLERCHIAVFPSLLFVIRPLNDGSDGPVISDCLLTAAHCMQGPVWRHDVAQRKHPYIELLLACERERRGGAAAGVHAGGFQMVYKAMAGDEVCAGFNSLVFERF